MCNRTLASDRAVNILVGSDRSPSLTATMATMATNHQRPRPLELNSALAEILDRDQRTTCHRTNFGPLANHNYQQYHHHHHQLIHHQQRYLPPSSTSSSAPLQPSSLSSTSSSTLSSSCGSSSSSVVVLDCCGLRTSNHKQQICAISAGDNNRSSNNLVLNSGDLCSISTVSSFKDNVVVNNNNNSVSSSTVSTAAAASSSDPEIGTNNSGTDNQVGNAGFRRTRWQRSVVTWLRLGGLLLALLTVSVHSAPAVPTAAMMMALQDKRWASQPKWTNPCGFEAQDLADPEFEAMQLSDEMLLGNILTQAKTALNYAISYRDEYVRRVFNTEFMDLHLQWKSNRYEWLPSLDKIPKELGEPLDQQYLDRLQRRMLDSLLQDSYEIMQTFAAGLEQVTWDQEDFHQGFHKQFSDSEYMLRTVLCEIQVAQVERGVTPRADVQRDVMPPTFRNMSASAGFRDLRDWLIFRDYMNGLEYIIQVFEYLKRLIES